MGGVLALVLLLIVSPSWAQEVTPLPIQAISASDSEHTWDGLTLTPPWQPTWTGQWLQLNLGARVYVQHLALNGTLGNTPCTWHSNDSYAWRSERLATEIRSDVSEPQPVIAEQWVYLSHAPLTAELPVNGYAQFLRITCYDTDTTLQTLQVLGHAEE